MDEKFEKLTESINELKNLFLSFHTSLQSIEKRLSRLEKVDSIEHRVAVNQIDLSDIKESLQRIEDIQSSAIKDLENNDQQALQYINRRLDSHLIKLAKAEEDIIILKNK